MSAWTRWVESRTKRLLHGARVSKNLAEAALLRRSLPPPAGPDPGGPPDPDSLLVLGTGYIGDLVLATPTLQLLRRAFPAARVTLVVREAVADLLAEATVHDRLVTTADPGRRELLGLAEELRAEGPDVVVALPHTVDAALFAFATGAPVRVGHASQGRGFLLTRPAGNRKSVHEVERQLDLARALGARAAEPDPPAVWPRRGARESAARLLGGFGPAEGPTVALPVGARNPARRWSPAKYAALIHRLAEARGARFLLLGAGADRPAAEEIATRVGEGAPAPDGTDRWPDRVLDLTGRTTLAEVAWLLDGAALTVGSDSGLLHLAAARGCPVVGLYGPGDPVAWGPRGPGHAVVRIPMPCSPCANHVCRSVACIRELAVEPVVAEALARLDGERGAAEPPVR